ncbi:MAG: hypothetical protein ACRCX8_07275 [Sarcina sp.]
MLNRNSSKQLDWCNDIKLRIEILKNGFLDKCDNLEDIRVQETIKRVDLLLSCTKTTYIIDEFKSINDEFIIRMFNLTDKKYCNMFISVFNNTSLLYQLQQKTRLEQQKQLKEIFKKYGNRRY